ncbi:MAG: hypothetical protein WC052_02790 [Patescibacteria group bacterium]
MAPRESEGSMNQRDWNAPLPEAETTDPKEETATRMLAYEAKHALDIIAERVASDPHALDDDLTKAHLYAIRQRLDSIENR